MKPALAGALLLLAGCSATSGDGLAALRLRLHQDAANLKAFTIADVQAAYTMADARGDLAAKTCYPAVLVVLQAQGTSAWPIKGVVSAFEALRLVVRPQAPRDDTVRVACMALLVQTLADLARLEAAAAKAVATSGASAVPEAPEAARQVIGLLRALGVGILE